jgi:hypothetical protein
LKHNSGEWLTGFMSPTRGLRELFRLLKGRGFSVCVRTHQSRRDGCELLSAVPSGLDFARIPYPALRAGLLSAVPSGLNPGPAVLTQTLKPRRFKTGHKRRAEASWPALPGFVNDF